MFSLLLRSLLGRTTSSRLVNQSVGWQASTWWSGYNNQYRTDHLDCYSGNTNQFNNHSTTQSCLIKLFSPSNKISFLFHCAHKGRQEWGDKFAFQPVILYMSRSITNSNEKPCRLATVMIAFSERFWMLMVVENGINSVRYKVGDYETSIIFHILQKKYPISGGGHTLNRCPLASEWTLSYETSQCIGILITFYIGQVM